MSGQDAQEYTQEQLEEMTKAELLEICAELGIESVSNSNTKAEIVEAILVAQEVASGGD